MQYKIQLLLICLFFNVVQSQQNWAVLIASSNDFWNYRHQADVCHAQNVLLANGFNPENIITFAYDDIAFHKSNPFQGNVFNHPDGKELYASCKIDYKAKDVNPQNFLRVLRGEGEGKILRSTKEDNVFIFFSDHGAVGLLAFPQSMLYRDDLINTFTQMNQKQMYNKLVFFLEACESGSMFETLPKDINIYALSASDSKTSSWATYCPPDDQVNGKHLNTCLGDLFSVNWIELVEASSEDITLSTLFQDVHTKTTKSRVMEWGDATINVEKISNFLTSSRSKETSTTATRQSSYQDSRDIKLNYLLNLYAQEPTNNNLVILQAEINERQKFDNQFSKLATNLSLNVDQHPEDIDMVCFKSYVQTFEQQCQPFSEYGLKYAKYLAQVCNQQSLLQAREFGIILQEVC